jgi:hypothetical protein
MDGGGWRSHSGFIGPPRVRSRENWKNSWLQNRSEIHGKVKADKQLR